MRKTYLPFSLSLNEIRIIYTRIFIRIVVPATGLEPVLHGHEPCVLANCTMLAYRGSIFLNILPLLAKETRYGLIQRLSWVRAPTRTVIEGNEPSVFPFTLTRHIEGTIRAECKEPRYSDFLSSLFTCILYNRISSL